MQKTKPQTKTISDMQYILIPLNNPLDETTLSEFEITVEPLLQGQHAYLVFDLGQLNFLNTRVIGYLSRIHKRVRKSEKKIAFINNNDLIFAILEMAGLSEAIPTFDAEAAFVAAIRDEQSQGCQI